MEMKFGAIPDSTMNANKLIHLCMNVILSLNVVNCEGSTDDIEGTPVIKLIQTFNHSDSVEGMQLCFGPFHL